MGCQLLLSKLFLFSLLLLDSGEDARDAAVRADDGNRMEDSEEEIGRTDDRIGEVEILDV